MVSHLRFVDCHWGCSQVAVRFLLSTVSPVWETDRTLAETQTEAQTEKDGQTDSHRRTDRQRQHRRTDRNRQRQTETDWWTDRDRQRHADVQTTGRDRQWLFVSSLDSFWWGWREVFVLCLFCMFLFLSFFSFFRLDRSKRLQCTDNRENLTPTSGLMCTDPARNLRANLHLIANSGRPMQGLCRSTKHDQQIASAQTDVLERRWRPLQEVTTQVSGLPSCGFICSHVFVIFRFFAVCLNGWQQLWVCMDQTGLADQMGVAEALGLSRLWQTNHHLESGPHSGVRGAAPCFRPECFFFCWVFPRFLARPIWWVGQGRVRGSFVACCEVEQKMSGFAFFLSVWAFTQPPLYWGVANFHSSTRRFCNL